MTSGPPRPTARQYPSKRTTTADNDNPVWIAPLPVVTARLPSGHRRIHSHRLKLRKNGPRIAQRPLRFLLPVFRLIQCASLWRAIEAGPRSDQPAIPRQQEKPIQWTHPPAIRSHLRVAGRWRRAARSWPRNIRHPATYPRASRYLRGMSLRWSDRLPYDTLLICYRRGISRPATYSRTITRRGKPLSPILPRFLGPVLAPGDWIGGLSIVAKDSRRSDQKAKQWQRGTAIQSAIDKRALS